MGTYADPSEVEVLDAFLKRLRDTLNLSDKNCYEIVGEDPPSIPTGGDYFLTVTVGGGTFNEIPEQFDLQCCESIDLTVTIYSRIRSDQTNTDAQLLKDVRRGLLSIKRLVLKALVDAQLQRENGDYILRNPIYAKSAGAPLVVQQVKGGLNLGRLPIVFAAEFDWDLTSE